MRISRLIVAVSLLLPAAAASGQEIVVGAPVRVELSSPRGGRIDGKLVAITDDSIFIARKFRRDVRLARGDVQRVYTGIHNSEVQAGFAGMLFGAPVGMLVGATAGAIIPKSGSGRRLIGGVAGAAGGLVVGAILGGIIGPHHRMTIWIEAPWPLAQHGSTPR